jgi:hypothetical protein
VREREAKAAVRDRSVAIGSPTNQCRRPDVNAPKRVFSGAAGLQGGLVTKSGLSAQASGSGRDAHRPVSHYITNFATSTIAGN